MDKTERDIAEVAYWLRSLGRYGSETKAFVALSKRKSSVGCKKDELSSKFSAMIRLHDRTLQHVASVLSDANRSFHPQLTKQQFDEGTDTIRKRLTEEFPAIPDSIDYMIAMLWHMPYVR